MKFKDAPAGSLVRQVGVTGQPVFIKIDSQRWPLFLHYPHRGPNDDPVNAISLEGHPGEFEPDTEVETVNLLDLVMSPGEADKEFGKERGTTRAGIVRGSWPKGSYRKASKGALLVLREAAEKRYKRDQK
jgi:hypothetical protein